MSPKATTTPSGIAAPIWYRASVIAAPAIPRAVSPGRKKRSMTTLRATFPERCSTLGTPPTCVVKFVPVSAAGRRTTVADFLKHGHNRGETAFGSMTDVVNNSTPYLSDGDVNAIAVYLKSLPAISRQEPVAYDDATTAALRSGHAPQPGATIYAGTCVNCHGFDGKGFGPYSPALAANPVVLDNDPSSLINSMLNGSNPLVVEGTPDPYRMPQFRQQYSDQEIADVVTFIRNGWGNQAPAVTAAEVAKLRSATDPAGDQVIILKMR